MVKTRIYQDEKGKWWWEEEKDGGKGKVTSMSPVPKDELPLCRYVLETYQTPKGQRILRMLDRLELDPTPEKWLAVVDKIDKEGLLPAFLFRVGDLHPKGVDLTFEQKKAIVQKLCGLCGRKTALKLVGEKKLEEYGL